MATENEKIIEFRQNNEEIIDGIRRYIDIIGEARGKDDNKYGLSNVGIIYNNKVMEIVRIFHDHGLNFFDHNYISDFIMHKLSNNYLEAVRYIEKYMRVNVLIGHSSYFLKNSDRSELLYYKELCESIFEYDIEKDMPETINLFIQKGANSPLFLLLLNELYDEMKEDIASLLERLNVKRIDECIDELTQAYNTMMETTPKDELDRSRVLAKILFN